MSWDNWLGTNLTYTEEILKRGVLLTTPVMIDTSRARIALEHSAPRFLAYCAFARFARQNRAMLSKRSFLVVLRYPNHWEPAELVATAKLILNKNGEIVVNHHPPKGKRGHEIDADDLLRYSRIILFASEAIDLHPDVEVACTYQAPLDVSQANHFKGLVKLLDSGALDEEDIAVLKAVPSERFNSIFRINQSASLAIRKISKYEPKKSQEIEIFVNVEKGFGEASRWARNLREDLADWRAGRVSWSEIDKGILIFGPSGTGKTMFATALAKFLNISLVATSVTRWQASKDGHLGDLLKAMYSTFDDARQAAPCLIFLDELDSIGHRGRLPSRWENYTMQVVNALLECLDGATGREGVIVIGACNFPDKIDPALLRSGRLEKHVHFPFPDADARLEILEVYLPHLADSNRLRTIAERLPGKTGADINQMVREARRLARKGARKVTISDIEYLMPPVQILTDEELMRVSVHESGHAIVAAMLGIGDVLSVEVFDCDTHHPTETHAHGLTSIAHGNRLITPRSKMLADIATLLAGVVAEEIVLGERSNSAGGSQTSDLDRATRLAMEFLVVHGLGETLTTCFDAIDLHGMSELWKNQPLREAANRLLQSEFRRVKSLLSGRERDLRVMAEALVKAKKLSGNELDNFLQNKDKAVRKSRTG